MIKGLGRRGTRMLLVATAMLAGAAGIALATIPGSDGVINGCYEKRTGILRVIDTEPPANKKCLSFETPISWNQKGQDGAPGAPGANGKDGAPGATGANGQNGQDGVSVTSEALGAGDANCANGGSKFTAANGVTYACNGAKGDPGSLVESEDWWQVLFLTTFCSPPGTGSGTFFTWANLSAGDSAAFYKDPFGRVYLKGHIRDGSTEDMPGAGCGMIFDLPAGYRPASTEVHPTLTRDDSVDFVGLAQIRISQTGRVSAGRGSNREFLSLDGISFRAAN